MASGPSTCAGPSVEDNQVFSNDVDCIGDERRCGLRLRHGSGASLIQNSTIAGESPAGNDPTNGAGGGLYNSVDDTGRSGPHDFFANNASDDRQRRPHPVNQRHRRLPCELRAPR